MCEVPGSCLKVTPSRLSRHCPAPVGKSIALWRSVDFRKKCLRHVTAVQPAAPLSERLTLFNPSQLPLRRQSVLVLLVMLLGKTLQYTRFSIRMPQADISRGRSARYTHRITQSISAG